MIGKLSPWPTTSKDSNPVSLTSLENAQFPVSENEPFVGFEAHQVADAEGTIQNAATHIALRNAHGNRGVACCPLPTRIRTQSMVGKRGAAHASQMTGQPSCTRPRTQTLHMHIHMCVVHPSDVYAHISWTCFVKYNVFTNHSRHFVKLPHTS